MADRGVRHSDGLARAEAGAAVGGLRAGWARLRDAIAATFEREVEAGRAALWVPVLFGAGVLLYFGLPREPPLWALLLSLAAAIALAIANRHRVGAFRLALIAAVVLGGASMMKARTDMVSAPIIATAHTGELAGWVEEIEQFSANNRRIVVRVAAIEDIAPEATPFRVRITVRGQFDAVEIGSGIRGLVSLQPPPAPVMPGGYDFGRELFYAGIGASGFAYGPPDLVDLGPAPFGVRFKKPVAEFRAAVGARIEAALPGETGEIANALITGDRGGISDETTEALRRSGLGHILAISGLHMALVAGAVFAFLRAIFALSPSLALRRPIKKWAATGALLTAAIYLVLSGASIATQRSFIMLCVVLVAVLLDRRAFSVRNVAVAAAIVLILTPEALLTASFQMSFAATLALIAGFETVSERRRRRLAIGPPPERTTFRIIVYWAVGLALTSILAGLATAPFAAFHFNRTAPLSLLANLAAMPMVSLIVMPSALISVVLMPLGLEHLPLQLMDFGLRYMIDIAEAVSEWTGASGLVPAAPVAALLLVALGLIWLCLWRERWRLLGLPVMAAGVLVALAAPQPIALIEETASAVAIRGADGRFGLLGGGASFEFETWLRADADPRTIAEAELDAASHCDPVGCAAPIGDSGRYLALALTQAAMAEDCRIAAIVVAAFDAPANCAAALVIDRAALARGHAHAIYVEEGPDGELAFRVVPARPEIRRPWMPPLPDQ
jgi:competence protein ComEC